MMNRPIVEEYFQTLNQTLDSLDIMDKLERIWNLDETGIIMEHTPSSVIAKRGSKSVPGRTSNSRESITVVVTANPSGWSLPPMIIVRGKTRKALNAWNVGAGPEGAFWTYQSKAWIEDILAQEWFTKVFLPNIGEERPQLLLLDSHCSHETLGLLEAASKENITLLAFPPHTTHYLQPLDRSVFRSLKSNYNQMASVFMSDNPGQTISKATWPAIFRSAYNAALTHRNITSGFRACGVFPFNEDALPSEAFIQGSPGDSR